jgi:hypothetical protein
MSMLILNDYPIEKRTDRDLELPVFYEFLERTKGTIGSVLDVGAHHSADYYASRLRTYVDRYVALDPRDDPAVHEFSDDFIVGDAETIELPKSDLVVCLSTIEHIGQYPIEVVDYKVKRRTVVMRMIDAAEKYLWLSFPVGLGHRIPGEMAIVDGAELNDWLVIMRYCQVTYGFFQSDGPQAGYPWHACNREDVIDKPYIDSLGNCAICVLEVKK